MVFNQRNRQAACRVMSFQVPPKHPRFAIAGLLGKPKKYREISANSRKLNWSLKIPKKASSHCLLSDPRFGCQISAPKRSVFWCFFRLKLQTLGGFRYTYVTIGFAHVVSLIFFAFCSHVMYLRSIQHVPDPGSLKKFERTKVARAFLVVTSRVVIGPPVFGPYRYSGFLNNSKEITGLLGPKKEKNRIPERVRVFRNSFAEGEHFPPTRYIKVIQGGFEFRFYFWAFFGFGLRLQRSWRTKWPFRK